MKKGTASLLLPWVNPISRCAILLDIYLKHQSLSDVACNLPALLPGQPHGLAKASVTQHPVGVLDENEIGVDPVAGNVLFVSQCEAVREREKSYCILRLHAGCEQQLIFWM